MALAHLTDLVAVAQGRLLQQYKSLTTTLVPTVEALVAPVQTVEDALWDYVAMMILGTSTGVWLEQLARIVGEEREAATDANLRHFIAARVLANNSQGRVEDVLAVTREMIDVPGAGSGATLVLQQLPPAAMLLTISDYAFSSATLRNRLKRMLAMTRGGGIGLQTVYQLQASDAEMFTFAWADGSPAVTGKGWCSIQDPTDGGHLSAVFVS